MSNLVMSGTFAKQQLEKSIRALAFTFLTKLSEDDTAPGLHIEPINNSIDSRVRTGRVNDQYRAVIYKLGHENGEPTYLFAGVWNHDDAIDYARTHRLQVNPVNGVAELIEGSKTDNNAGAATPVVESERTRPQTPILKEKSYIPADLVDGFGFSPDVANYVFALQSEDDVRKYAATLPTTWHAEVLDGMLAGMSVDEIKVALDLVPARAEEVETDQVEPFERESAEVESTEIRSDETDPAGAEIPQNAELTAEPATKQAPPQGADDDAALLAALRHPAAQAQWKFIEDNAELRDIIESGDLAGWRVFLHPEQRRYVERNYNGPYRLTGGAGTGKTVVLLHRARRLALANPDVRIILTTFTRQLAANLQRDLELLDPTVPIANKLGEPGVLIRGIDQLSVAVRGVGGADYSTAALDVVGEEISAGGALTGNADGWEDAVAIAGAELPDSLRSAPFLETEYLQVVLPNRITSLDQYRSVRRPGRGVMLDRAKRDAIWAVVTRQRRSARLGNKLSFSETAEIAAAYLENDGVTFADHILVDEGQDLIAPHWQLLRALVAPGPNDLFMAEDSHQRIYGQRLVLSRYGISLRGRSRRLSLNYRTTAENLRYAFGVLEGGQYVDPEGNEEGTIGHYRSARSGPEPRIVSASNPNDQVKKIVTVINEWVDEGVPASSIAVLTATRAPQLRERLTGAGAQVAEPKGDNLPSDKAVVLTMHKAKGLEFSRVVLNDISKGAYPDAIIPKKLPPEDRPEARSKARSLLYVAASRARDELVISYQGEPSELLVTEIDSVAEPLIVLNRPGFGGGSDSRRKLDHARPTQIP